MRRGMWCPFCKKGIKGMVVNWHVGYNEMERDGWSESGGTCPHCGKRVAVRGRQAMAPRPDVSMPPRHIRYASEDTITLYDPDDGMSLFDGTMRNLCKVLREGVSR